MLNKLRTSVGILCGQPVHKQSFTHDYPQVNKRKLAMIFDSKLES